MNKALSDWSHENQIIHMRSIRKQASKVLTTEPMQFLSSLTEVSTNVCVI